MVKRPIFKSELLDTIWYFARFKPSLFMGVVFFSFISGLLEGFGLSLFMPMLMNNADHTQVGRVMAKLMDSMESFGLGSHLQATILVLIIVFFLRNISRFLELHLKTRFEQGFIHYARNRILKGIFRMRYSDYFRRFQPSGTALMTSDIAILSQCIQNLLVFVVSICAAAMLTVASMAINPWTTFFSMAFGGLLFLLLKWITSKTRNASIALTGATKDYINRVQEIFAQYKYLRSTNQNPAMHRKAMRDSMSNCQGLIKIQSGNAFMLSLNQFLAIVFLSGVIYFAVEVRDQPVARVMISIAVIYRIISMITVGLGGLQMYAGVAGSFYSVRDNISLIENSAEKYGTIEHTRFDRDIRFENVEFVDNKLKLIEGVSCVIKKGEFLGLLGRTGAGKSLLTQLLTGLIYPTSGKVLIDGIDIEQIKQDRWRSRIGYVPQDIGVFTGTLREAICGDCQVTTPTEKAALERVIRQAHLDSVLHSMPQGLDTPVGVGGHPLSGGQKQRVAIARELFRDPEILILDEATNALDSATQEAIAQVIESIRGQLTIIMIAHRLRMVEKADHIIVMHEGKVLMDGGLEILKRYSDGNGSEEDESSERRPAPRLWVGVREDMSLILPELSNEPLKLTDLSISGLSFFGEEKWKLDRHSPKSYDGILRLGSEAFPIQVKPVRFAAGRLGGPLIQPSAAVTDAIQNFVMESFVVDVRKTG